ncbi:MAG: 50S ribosomal protein L23 [Candidatus Jacksonbacteria bacterium]|jgi:large subunit ribosomal protein L23|nr:50S ribosomal protein L23 [Candidatus Jacksonbacteria bacterium]MBT6034142.1 50S ribosomal protein L23 [Candidatus Jacksonbacteria bacterium]MBT6301227.1 50S ribosomal protein L23 [Candidatus Jacksonbacteria bacterium]MBT6757311.1 50S ribosomal protein L23 [Candidatus Jacksonbacteria bacterium]MBT6955608.1 50S ribosomal protein L23 [Candidatus Jacksonbacteria bacterium]
MALLNRKKATDTEAKPEKKSVPVKAAPKKPAPKKAVKGKAKEAEKPKKEAKAIHSSYSNILLRPIVTEKAASLGEDKVVFQVPLDVNKVQVKKAVHAIYGIRPVKIRMITLKGKSIRNKFSRALGARSAIKKAIVSLPKGKRIDVFENV